MYYSLPYLVYFFILILLYILGKKNAAVFKKCMIFACVSYLVFFGLRGYIYTDCFQYLDFYQDVPKLNKFQLYDGNFEFGYVYVNVLLNYISNNSFFFQFVMVLIDLVFLIIILRRETNQYFLLAFALLIPFWLGTQMNLFRNIKAILICFYALRFLREKRLWAYLGCIALAFFFHQTAIFFIPLYWFINKPCKQFMVGMCIAAVLLFFAGISFLSVYIQALGAMLTDNMAEKAEAFSTDAQSAGFTIGFVYRLLLMFLLLKNYEKLAKCNVCMLNIAILYLFSCTAFNSMIVFRDRFSALFSLSVPCILPYLFSLYLGIEKKILIVLNLLFTSGMVYAQTSNGGACYENILLGISSENEAKIRIFKASYEYMK